MNRRHFVAMTAGLMLLSQEAAAQDMGSIMRNMDSSAVSRMLQTAVGIGVLSIAPALLIVATSFTRIVIVLSILRTSIGLQTTPNNFMIISLALFMTFHIMGPVFEDSYKNGIQPYMSSSISEKDAIEKSLKPFGDFMKTHAREKDIEVFVDISSRSGSVKMDVNDIRILAPAFMTSELRRGFEIGFLIAIPFLIIDIVVATIVMSMGMMMMPPSVISLPVKIMFFVLIDGWNLVIGTLARSFA